jgi:hypothetical protein
MTFTNSYQARQFNLSGLNGISDRTLEMHFKLYEGYVKETNNLSDKISDAFFSNIDWNVCDERLKRGLGARSATATEPG